MLDFLAENHGKRLSINANERAELNYLRKEVSNLQESAKNKGE